MGSLLDSITRINNSQPAFSGGSAGGPFGPPPPAGSSFSDLLTKTLGGVNGSAARSEDLAQRLAAGEDVDLSELAVAATEASLQLQIAIQITGKIVSSLNELLHTNTN